MRFLVVTLLLGCCVASSICDNNIGGHGVHDSQKQKDIYRLFKHINQPSYYRDHIEIAKSYNWHEHKENYANPEAIEEYYKYWQLGLVLKRGEVFSIFHEEHLKQAIVLFKIFYYAKNWETFYQTAVWARNYANEGTYLYALSVALVHRPDTFHYNLPPIYETYPYYFYNTEVIHQAQFFKQLYNGQYGAKYNGRTIYSNHSGHYYHGHPEQLLSYFTEDVGVNSFYYYYSLYYPFWMSGEEFNLKVDKRGELFYYIHQQILARYYLERLSNGLGGIQYFNWEGAFETGYYPSMCYPNGRGFPPRPHYANLHEYFYHYGQKSVSRYDERISEAIDSGYVLTKSGQQASLSRPEGIDILGNLIEGTPDSPHDHYYGAYPVFARHFLGFAPQPFNHHNLHPSALEHFETSMRDPAFYKLFNNLFVHFARYKQHYYKSYTEKELLYEDVKVRNVEFDPLVTYFDYDYADITSAVYLTPEEFLQDGFKVQIAQQRLNHRPFTYKIQVDSHVETDAVVKVFLGPKYDEYHQFVNLTDNWQNFVQFDHFVYNFKAGHNVITRKSEEIYNYVHDRISYVGGNTSQHDEEDLAQNNHYMFGFPHRFVLPKGSKGGISHHFYVIVYKHIPYKSDRTGAPGSHYVDAYPLGYPFDRPVYWERDFFTIPNSYIQEVKIYHEDGHAAEEFQGHVHQYHHHKHADDNTQNPIDGQGGTHPYFLY